MPGYPHQSFSGKPLFHEAHWVGFVDRGAMGSFFEGDLKRWLSLEPSGGFLVASADFSNYSEDHEQPPLETLQVIPPLYKNMSDVEIQSWLHLHYGPVTHCHNHVISSPARQWRMAMAAFEERDGQGYAVWGGAPQAWKDWRDLVEDDLDANDAQIAACRERGLAWRPSRLDCSVYSKDFIFLEADSRLPQTVTGALGALRWVKEAGLDWRRPYARHREWRPDFV